MGLAVDPQARENLMAASRAVLESVAAKIPKEAQYRENVEATFRIWLNMVRRPPPCESIVSKRNLTRNVHKSLGTGSAQRHYRISRSGAETCNEWVLLRGTLWRCCLMDMPAGFRRAGNSA